MARLYVHKKWGWQLHYRVFFADGTSKRKFRYFKNKLLGLKFLREAEVLEYKTLHHISTQDDARYWVNLRLLSKEEATRIVPILSIDLSLGELLEEYLKRSEIICRKTVHRINTYRVKHLIDFFGKDAKVDSITDEAIRNYCAKRLNDGVSAATINKELIKLAQILDLAVEKGVLKKNPARHFRLKDKKERKPRALSREEVKRLLAVASKEKRLLGGYLYPILLTYLYTGMRRSELLFLEWEDIDFENRRVKIQAKLESGFITKTGEARVVGLAQRLLEILRALPRQGRFVFGGESPLCRPDAITRAFNRIRAKAGLPRTVTLHSLRHTYITHLLEKGVGLRRVMELAGHKQLETAARYIHVTHREVEEDLLDFENEEFSTIVVDKN